MPGAVSPKHSVKGNPKAPRLAFFQNLDMIKTGNNDADKLLRYVAAHCARMPGDLGSDYRAGVLSMFFGYGYLTRALSETIDDESRERVAAALDYLVDSGFIRLERHFQHGGHVWLLQPVRDLAA